MSLRLAPSALGFGIGRQRLPAALMALGRALREASPPGLVVEYPVTARRGVKVRKGYGD